MNRGDFMFNVECLYCGNINSNDLASCTKCGAQYAADIQKICIRCRNKIVGNNMFCGACGTSIVAQEAPQTSQPVHWQQPIQQNQTPQVINVHMEAPRSAPATESSKSRGVALALCVFFGFFGAHLFYVGKAGRGIIYILTAGLFFVGVFLNFFSILFGVFKDKEGLPLKKW